MTRSEAIRQLQEEYAQQRQRNQQALDNREAEARRLDPVIGELQEASTALVLDTMRSLLSLTDPAEKARITEQMRRKGIENSQKLRARLAALGLPEDALELKYRCPLCRDTGLVGNAPARFCSCFEARLNARMHEDGSMAAISEQNFSTFNLDLFPQENGQRQQMEAARGICEAYADTVPDSRWLNLILTGAGGLGKTFLLNCIYARAEERGQNAVRTTAFNLFNAMRQQHMGSETGAEAFTAFTQAPLLLIDDLGTEPLMKNITIEYLFLLLNERLVNRRHTVIATNLSPAQLQERYGERVSSRLLDRRNCGVMQLTGKDLRTL